MPPVSKINQGLKPLRRDNPWPDFGYGEIEPFYLPLDGGGRGGREIVLDVIKERKIELMVEIGCFLCGSTLQWLRASENLTVIGCDPWDSNWAAYIENMAQDPLRARTVYHLTDEQIATIVRNIRRHGNFQVAMNNVRLYSDRFIPVRRRSPEVLTYLHERGVEPQLIYIDADKKRDDLDIVQKLFPNAILCGDDWLWPDETGKMVMQEHVKDFAREHGYEVRSARQTWLLIAP
jgi:predicted O-methyltransferase YrrM